MTLHPLLRRQLKRLGIDPEAEDTQTTAWRALLERVSRAYEEHDQEAYLLERSQELASQEMAQLYATLRADRDLLESRVQERTEALQLSEGRLQNLVSLSADWIWEQDAELRFTYVSDSVEAATGYSPQQMIGQQRVTSVDIHASPDAITAWETALEGRRPFRDFTHGFDRPDGMRCYVRISGEPVFDDAGHFKGYRGVGRDVTQDRLAEQKVQELARIDGLTGLPNRTWLLHRFPALLEAARADGVSLCLALIDLDGFKRINDEIGHHAGDRALLHVVGLLQDTPEDGEWLIRLGGEEFVMILRKPLGTSWERLDGLRRALLARRFVPEQGADPLLVTFSAGIACYPHDAEDLSNLLRRADLRLNAAKRNGRNRILARDA